MLTTELMNVEQRYYSQNIFLRILNVVNLESICYFNVMIIAVPIISFNKMLLKMTMLFFCFSFSDYLINGQLCQDGSESEEVFHPEQLRQKN